MSNLPIQFQSFNFNSSSVRIVIDPNQDLWFCGTDVCSILGYVNAPDAMKKHCKEAGIAKRYISHSSGRKEAIFINEPNLYRLIIKSRKPQAEKFEAWVFEEVLPQIRKTGQYSQNPQPNLPLVEPTYSIELKEEEIRQLAWLHFSHRRMMSLLGWVAKGLEVIGSKFAGEAYGCSTEYRRQSDKTKPTLERMIAKIEHKGTRQELTHRLTASV